MSDFKTFNGYNVKDAYAREEIAQMKINFQDGVDTIYNAIVSQGVTPSASTPSACADGIATVATNKYSEGENAEKNKTFSFNIRVSTYNSSTINELDVRRWVSVSCTRVESATTPVYFKFFNSSGTQLYSVQVRDSSVNLMNYFTLYPTTTKIQICGTGNANVTNWNLSIVAKNMNVR